MRSRSAILEVYYTVVNTVHSFPYTRWISTETSLQLLRIGSSSPKLLFSLFFFLRLLTFPVVYMCVKYILRLVLKAHNCTAVYEIVIHSYL